MTNAIATTNGTKYTNKGLQRATDKIAKLETSIKSNLYEAAAIISQVDREKLYEEDGFKNVHEWTKEAFGIEKSASYNMLKIGRDYTIAIADKNGRIKEYRSNLTGANETDFSTSQVIKMLPLSREELPEAIEAENITPADSARDIEAKIKHYKNKDKPETVDTESEAEDTESETEDTESEAEDKTHITLTRDFALKVFTELSKGKTRTAKELTEKFAEMLGI